MDSLDGKTAVVTGAASGMGLSFARRFAAAGMNVVLADVEEPALNDAVVEIEALGVQAVSSITDVSDGAQVDVLRDLALDRFGAVNVLCNNAGVAGGGNDAEWVDPKEWEWVLGVNLWGVIHGHRAFLPHMVEHGDGHIVNTASMAGHLPSHSAYGASKFAVASITEGLFHALAQRGSTVGVSCLCPGWVDTKIIESERNRPEWAAPSVEAQPSEEAEFRRSVVADLLKSGAKPDEVAELVHDAILSGQFWIFTTSDFDSIVADRHRAIEQGANPTATLGL